MPFVNRFASPVAPPARHLAFLRDHPVVIAGGAATAGVLLGAFVAVQLLATPAKVNADATQPGTAVDARPAPPIAETTGTAPSSPSAGAAGSDLAAADCDKQTWPNLSRDCMKNNGARVVTATSKPARPTGGVVEPPAPAATAPAAAPEPVVVSEPAKPAPAVQPAPAPEQTAAVPEPKPKPKHVARKQKRKPAQREFDDDANGFAAANPDDGPNTRRIDRSRHLAQRGNERSYDRRDNDDDGRRVIVIRRGPVGLFGGLFGNFDSGDDD